MLSLGNYSTDALLEVTAQLELPELFSFLSVCSSLRKLSEIPSLWIDVLQRTERSRPIACPVGTDLTRLGIDDLQRIARHTHRLQRNWSTEEPRSWEPVTHELPTPDSSYLLSVIPGTSMVILAIREAGGDSIVLYSCEQASVVGTILPAADIKNKNYASHDAPGRYLAAFTFEPSESSGYRLLVISISHGIGQKTSIQTVYETTLKSTPYPLFLRDGLVGYLHMGEQHSTGVFLHAINIVTNQSVDIPMDPDAIEDDARTGAWLALGPALFFVNATFSYGGHYRSCPAELLPHGLALGDAVTTETANRNREMQKIAYPRSPASEVLFSAMSVNLAHTYGERVMWSRLGVHVFIHVKYMQPPNTDINERTTVYFWPFDPDPARSPDSTAIPMWDHEPAASVHLRGTLRHCVLSPSGSYAILTTNREIGPPGSWVNDQRPSRPLSDLHIHLVHFIRDPTAKIEVRRIALLSSPPSSIKAIEIDERLGVLYLFHGLKDLMTVSFA